MVAPLASDVQDKAADPTTFTVKTLEAGFRSTNTGAAGLCRFLWATAHATEAARLPKAWYVCTFCQLAAGYYAVT